jgi:hypothetical protein
MARRKAKTDFITPLADADVPQYHQETLKKYRQLAAEHGVPTTVAVCYRVRGGFTLRTHAPKAGPCRRQFDYIQGWKFLDEPTTDSLVFWVPRLLKDSVMKTYDEQMAFLAEMRQRLGLPEHHLSGFGKISLLASLILAHFKATGERVPLDRCWIRTDTCNTLGRRLTLGDFDETGLYCVYWHFDGSRDGLSTIGVFALGMEALGN